MRIISGLIVTFITFSCTVQIVLGASPIRNVSVTLRGQKYDINDVTTVQDIQEQLEEQSGVSTKQQGKLIFGGKKLDTDTVLADVGIEDGTQLNMVPSSSSSSNKKKTTTTASSSTSSTSETTSTNPMADYLKSAGIDTNEINEMMKSMNDGKGPNMEDSIKAMTDAMNSPLMQQMMSDPEKLEESRQMILNNPMLKSMMGSMPGMDELLNDKDAWREAMQAAAEMYKNMDSETLMKAMMGGMGGAGMPGGGLFDGTLDESTAAAALDELDEED